MNTNTGGADIKKQKRKLIEYMKNHRFVTRKIAMYTLGIANNPEIIRRLKCDGYTIGDKWVYPEEGARYKIYWLVEDKE